MLSKAPRGTKDITPKDVYKWHYVLLIQLLNNVIFHMELMVNVFI